MPRIVAWMAKVDLRRLCILLFITVGIMGVMGIATRLIGRGYRWFDLDAEISPHWPITATTIAFPALWSGLLLVAASAGWLAASSVWPDRRTRGFLLVLSLFFLIMAGDEATEMHERFEYWTGIDWQALYAIPVLVMAIATLVVLWKLRAIDPRAARLLLLGCVAWGISQLLELLEWIEGDEIAGYVYLMVAEEILEASGSVLFIAASVRLIQALRPPVADPSATDRGVT